MATNQARSEMRREVSFAEVTGNSWDIPRATAFRVPATEWEVGGGRMADAKTERSRALVAGEERGETRPGDEERIARLKVGGKATGEQAAVQIIAAEKKKLAGIA